MSDYVKVVEACIQEASHDECAARILRRVLKGAAERAPVDALVEIVQTILDIRERDVHSNLERN